MSSLQNGHGSGGGGSALYHASSLVKTVSGPAGELTILKGVDLTVRAGETLAIVGSSGSGKSTLLHILGTLDRATSGTLLFEGRDLTRLSPTEAAAFRSRELGFVFQFHHLLPEFTTIENVAIEPKPRIRRSRSSPLTTDWFMP